LPFSQKRLFGHLERMDETNLVKRVREERVPRHTGIKRPKKSWDEVVKADIKKRSLCINDAIDRNKWRRCCKSGRLRLTGKNPAVKAERRRLFGLAWFMICMVVLPQIYFYNYKKFLFQMWWIVIL